MKTGYVRGQYSSTEIGRIVGAFETASCREVIIDAAPQYNKLFQRLLGRLEPQDVLVTWTLECIANSSDELTQIVFELSNRGIGFEVVSQSFTTFDQSVRGIDRVSHTLRRLVPPSASRARLIATEARQATEHQLRSLDSANIRRVAT